VKTDYDLNDHNIKAIAEPRLIVGATGARDSLAAALSDSLPVIAYSFFVEYYVSSLTGAVKE
jgi:hypothetical protein